MFVYGGSVLLEAVAIGSDRSEHTDGVFARSDKRAAGGMRRIG